MNKNIIANQVSYYYLVYFLFQFFTAIKNAMMNIFMYEIYFLASKGFLWIDFQKQNFWIKKFDKLLIPADSLFPERTLWFCLLIL